MLLTASQMKAAEETAFMQGASPAGLMEVAGVGIAQAIRQFFPAPGTVVVFCGKGHNGGDALVAAHHLAGDGWKVLVRLASGIEELAPLTRSHLQSLPAAAIIETCPKITGESLILIDGLLGIGSTGAPRGVIADRIGEMNRLRRSMGGFSIAIDLPSGLQATTGEVFDPCIQADLTITIGAVKTGLVSDRATAVVGRLALVPLPDISADGGDPDQVATAELLRPLLPIRSFDSFKGTYGRIGILAGSRGTLGAASLCSAAAVHGGGGLVTLYTLPENYGLLTSLCIPEVMVQQVDSYLEILEHRHDVLGIGSGLGRSRDKEILRLIRESPLPCVLDADALNAVATDLSMLTHSAGPRLLTPHPGEMERLEPQAGRTRRVWATEFVERYPVTLLLKGSRTIVAQGGESPLFNTTGNPGMGTGGMGDVLTGLCTALIGGGQTLWDAAILGAWLSGRAAELAIFQGTDSQESLAASSVIGSLGRATEALRRGEF